jgi:hypothetical protein
LLVARGRLEERRLALEEALSRRMVLFNSVRGIRELELVRAPDRPAE